VLLPNRYPGTSTVYAMRECFQIHHSVSPASVTMKNKSFSALIPCNTFTCVYCETLRFPISDQADSMRFIDALIWIPCCDELSNCCVTMTSGLECYSMTSESITGDERKKWEWMSKFQKSLICHEPSLGPSRSRSRLELRNVLRNDLRNGVGNEAKRNKPIHQHEPQQKAPSIPGSSLVTVPTRVGLFR